MAPSRRKRDIMEPAVIIHRPVEVDDRLSSLGLSQAILREAVIFGRSYAWDMTENDPPSSKGMVVWGKTTRKLRELLKPYEWRPENHESYSTTVHPSGRWAIAVAAGDWRTGLENETPETRSKKGAATKTAIAHNQMRFGQFDPAWDDAKSGKDTWLLLHYFDFQSGETRAELSLPQGMSIAEHVSAWRKRLILSWPDSYAVEPHVLPNDISPFGDDLTDEVDVPVVALP